MIAFIAAHVWQSTIVVGLAAVVAWFLRGNHARARHAVWTLASLKFLLPFAALVAAGEQLSLLPGFAGLSGRAAVEVPAVMDLFDTAAQSFAFTDLRAIDSPAGPAATSNMSAIAFAVWIAGMLLVVGAWLARWIALSRVLRASTHLVHGREADILSRVAHSTGLPSVPLLASTGSMEPGVVGCTRPAILWPMRISERMTDEQIAAIMLHELVHVRRRDNLLSVVHMVVEAVFWFHPLVWYVGARLLDAREEACDEEVVRLGADPSQYAESILRTCEYAAESRLACVAGVTGADLKRRVVAIISSRQALRLGATKVALLTVIGLVVAVGPLAAGVFSRTEEVAAALGNLPPASPSHSADTANERIGPVSPPAGTRRFVPAPGELVAAPSAQQAAGAGAAAPPPAPLKFEVASIKLIRSDSGGSGAVAVAGGGGGRAISRFNHAGPINQLFQRAYGVPEVQLIGAPQWLGSDDSNYRIAATIPEGVESTPENINAMLRSLLADRFKAVVREETRELPTYELVVARADKTLGPNLTPVAPECLVPGNTCERGIGGGPSTEPGGRTLRGRNTSIQQLSNGPFGLERRVGRPVVDRTGLTGGYNFDLAYADQNVSLAPTTLSSLFDALQEQLGLKLVSTRGPVKVLVIVSIERPTED